jgi:hypothetical protein
VDEPAADAVIAAVVGEVVDCVLDEPEEQPATMTPASTKAIVAANPKGTFPLRRISPVILFSFFSA